MPNCNEASIESCARVNLNFDAFDSCVNIFGTSMQRNHENDLDIDSKFFEVTLHQQQNFLNMINILKIFQASDFSYLSLSRSQTQRRNARQANQACESLHGTIKLTGVATYAIENCGDCDCTLLIKKLDDGSFHQQYDESGLKKEITELPTEVCKLF